MTKIVIAGAAGGIGEGVVQALLADPTVHVYAVSRSAKRLESLRERLEPRARSRFEPLVGDPSDFAGAEAIAGSLEEHGGVDAAIAILGRGFWTSGPLLELAPSQWSAVLDEMLTAHFAFARALIPALTGRSGSVYLALGGGAAFAPMRDAGLMSIAAAGQAMLTRVLALEAGAAGPRICELVVNAPVNTREAQDADPDWPTAAEVGGVVADLVLRGATAWQPLREEGPLIVMEPRGGAGKSLRK